MKRISVIGLGYVGLPTAILSAQSGYEVCGFDIDIDKISRIRVGDPTIVEPEIRHRLNLVLSSGSLKIENQLSSADCFIIAVPTPLKKEKESILPLADMTFVFNAGKEIARVLKPGNLVILESTVKVGTTMRLAKFLAEKSGLKFGLDFFVAHCPERILPGNTFNELRSNDRVIGGVCEQSSRMAKKFYSKFVQGRFELVDDKTAEMVKLVENSSRDVQIAYANQVASMATKVGINPYKLIDLANKHPRVNILSPGCGVGGHCIAVDPWFLIESFPNDKDLLHSARNINDEVPLKVLKTILEKVEKLKLALDRKPKVGILGLAFKPNVDDVRHSPALKIAKELMSYKNDLDLLVNDPYLFKSFFIEKKMNQVSDMHSLIKQSDLIVLLVCHRPFLDINQEEFIGKVVLDKCGLLGKIKESSDKIMVGASKETFNVAVKIDKGSTQFEV